MRFGRCTICTSSFTLVNVSSLKCGHTFHYECIRRWIEGHKSCPNCRLRNINSDIKKLFFDEADESFTQEVPSEKAIEQLSDELESEKAKNTKQQATIESLELNHRIVLNDNRMLKDELRTVKDSVVSKGQHIQHLESLIVDQDMLRNQNRDLTSRYKACKFYDFLKGNSKVGNVEHEIKKYISSSGDPDSTAFINLMQGHNQSYKKMIQEQKSEINKLKIALHNTTKELQKFKSGTKRPAQESASQPKDYSRHPRPSFGFRLDDSVIALDQSSSPNAKRTSENGAGSDDVFNARGTENISPRSSICFITEIKANNSDRPGTSKAAYSDFRVDSSGSLDDAILNQLKAFESTPVKKKSPAVTSKPVEMTESNDDDVCILSPQIPKSRFERSNNLAFSVKRKLTSLSDKPAICHNNALKILGNRNGNK